MASTSFKSGEGLGMWGTLLGGGYLIFDIISNGNADVITNQVISLSDTPLGESVEAVLQTGDWTGMGTVGIICTFIYKVYAKFTESRTEVKKIELAKD